MQNMTLALRALMLLTVSVGIVSLGAPPDAFGHGKESEKKGTGPARVEVGPHGGAVLDLGDAHFELARDPAGTLSLYRLDDDLKATVEAMSDEDTKKTIDRGTFQAPFELQLEFYLQAMFIFFGKVMIYLRAMNKDIPKDMEAWIG